MSALLAFALRHWRGALGLAAVLVLAALLANRTGQRDEARVALARSEQARALFAARVRARAAETARDFTERARRTEQSQARISQEVSHDYQNRMADLRRRVDALRLRGRTDRADPGRAAAARLPGLPDAAGGFDAAAVDHRLSLEHRIAATEQAIRLEELQRWIRRQQAAGRTQAEGR
jgi:hypothetical protein